MLRSIILAARPKTLPAAIVPVWAGCVLSWKLAGVFDLKLAVCTLLGAISIQIATNFFNDAIDAAKGADTSKRAGPKRVTASGLLSSRSVLMWGGVFVVLAFAFGVVLYQARGWPILLIGLPSLFLSYGYTGGPFPLAYRGMGEVFVILFFGLVAVCGTVFIQTRTWPVEGCLLGLQTGLLSAVLISINNLRDREEDATTGKHTVAVRLGEQWAAYLIFGEIVLPAALGILWLTVGLGSLLWSVLPILGIGSIIASGILHHPEGPACNRLLALSGLQLLAFALAFHAAALLN